MGWRKMNKYPKKVSKRSATEWLCRRRNDEIGDGMGKSAAERRYR